MLIVSVTMEKLQLRSDTVQGSRYLNNRHILKTRKYRNKSDEIYFRMEILKAI